MNWDMLNALAQLVGAAGVIISLIYVGVQVRQNTKALRMGTAANVMQWNSAVTDPLIRDPRLAAAIAQAVSTDGGHPDPGVQLQVHAWLYAVLKQAETAYYHYTNGFIDDELWGSWSTWMQLWLKTPGFTAYWRRRNAGFHPAFRRQVEAWLEASLSMAAVGSSMSAQDEHAALVRESP